MESELIDKINNIDVEIGEIKQRIERTLENETSLHKALKAARTAEHKCTNNYANSPGKRTQLLLENSRDFVTACQKRVNLFTNNVSILNNDVDLLWSERKRVLGELSRLRANNVRPSMKVEAESLLREISARSIRLLALTSQLDGQNILRLDLTQMIVHFNLNHKRDLLEAKKSLDDSFERLTTDRITTEEPITEGVTHAN